MEPNPRTTVRARRRGFSLIELLVCISIIALLIALLTPAFTKITEASRRVTCQSNIRQVGTGVLMFAEEHEGVLPPSIFLRPQSNGTRPLYEMNTLRVNTPNAPEDDWDGLGLLFSKEYLPAPKIFYCPSHRGQESFTVYTPRWNGERGTVRGNYHFRGEGPAGNHTSPNGQVGMTRYLSLIDPAQSSLITDSLRIAGSPNHAGGANFFRADLSVHWYPASLGTLLPSGDNVAVTSDDIINAWRSLDTFATGGITGNQSQAR